MCRAPKIPDPVKPTPTQEAKAPTRSWVADPNALRRPGLIGGSGATARPTTSAPGMVLGR